LAGLLVAGLSSSCGDADHGRHRLGDVRRFVTGCGVAALRGEAVMIASSCRPSGPRAEGREDASSSRARGSRSSLGARRQRARRALRAGDLVALARIASGKTAAGAPSALPFTPAAATAGAASFVTLPSLFGCSSRRAPSSSEWLRLARVSPRRSRSPARVAHRGAAHRRDRVGQVTPGRSSPPRRSSATCSRGRASVVARRHLPSCVSSSSPSAVSGARLRASPGAAAFLDGVNVASLALMAVVTVQWRPRRSSTLRTVLIGALRRPGLRWRQGGSTWLAARWCSRGLDRSTRSGSLRALIPWGCRSVLAVLERLPLRCAKACTPPSRHLGIVGRERLPRTGCWNAPVDHGREERDRRAAPWNFG